MDRRKPFGPEQGDLEQNLIRREVREGLDERNRFSKRIKGITPSPTALPTIDLSCMLPGTS